MKNVASQQAIANVSRWQQVSIDWIAKGNTLPRVKNAREAVAAGIQLLLLKESLPHGEFTDRANALGLSHRTTTRYMRVAKRFHHASDAFFDAVGGASKLFALLELDSAESLAKGKPVDGLTLEVIANMSFQELDAAIQQRKGARQACAKGQSGNLDAQVLQALCLADTPIAVSERTSMQLNVQEERMLRRYRKCKREGQEALLQIAGLLVASTT